MLVAALVAAPTPSTVRTRLADGFDFPVGKPDADGYYISRGFRANGHLGEDWNGARGGNTDLGDPVYCVANGFVVFARDARLGWGNVVIVRHLFLEGGRLVTADSLYAHLDKIMAREGQQLVKGAQVGTIGTNRGMYEAHLHFEMRKNIAIGVDHSAFKRDLSNYYLPSPFINARRKLSGAGRSGVIQVNTFHDALTTKVQGDDSKKPGPSAAPSQPPSKSGGIASKTPAQPSPQSKAKTFQVNRFDDL